MQQIFNTSAQQALNKLSTNPQSAELNAQDSQFKMGSKYVPDTFQIRSKCAPNMFKTQSRAIETQLPYSRFIKHPVRLLGDLALRGQEADVIDHG